MSVSINDLIKNDSVYVKDYGIFVTRQETGMTLAEYIKKTENSETILERVRKMPDQTFESAWKAVRRPVQNNGPTMLSLACDNAKFVVERNGKINYGGITVFPRISSNLIELIRMDFGEIGIDTTVRPQGQKGLSLTIGDKTYNKGIGLHANAELLVPLNGKYSKFEAEAGVYPYKTGASVLFEVEVDGQSQFNSGVMRKDDAPKKVNVALDGARQMILRLTDAGDGIENDAGNWANARLIPAKAEGDAEAEYLSDILKSYNFEDAAAYTRALEDKSLPIIVNTALGRGLITRQRTFVAPYNLANKPLDSIGTAKAIFVSEFTIENPAEKKTDVDMHMGFAANSPENLKPVLQRKDGRLFVTYGERLLVCVDISNMKPLKVSVQGDRLVFTGELPAETTRQCVVYIPAFDMKLEDYKNLPGSADLLAETKKYWKEILEPAMQINVP